MPGMYWNYFLQKLIAERKNSSNWSSLLLSVGRHEQRARLLLQCTHVLHWRQLKVVCHSFLDRGREATMPGPQTQFSTLNRPPEHHACNTTVLGRQRKQKKHFMLLLKNKQMHLTSFKSHLKYRVFYINKSLSDWSCTELHFDALWDGCGLPDAGQFWLSHVKNAWTNFRAEAPFRLASVLS